jgi:glucokinase
LALAEPGGRPERIVAIEDDAVADLQSALRAYLDGLDEPPRAAVLAVAGPVEGRRIALTNRDWSFDLDALQAEFGFARIHALNDFEALAWALPALGAQDVRALGPAAEARCGAKVVLGPGTGLGVAALVPHGNGWLAVPSEGGHISFGPSAPDEASVFAHIARSCDLVSAEHAISGPGLERLDAALRPERARREAKEIAAAATAGDATARAAVELFVRLLGRFAGDMALIFRATGGVYIAGGVALRLGALLDKGVFRAAFEAHPPYRELLASVPTFLITSVEPGLLGCAAFAAQWQDESAAREK